MPLVHGKAISAEEVERIVSREFTPQKFASLCNAISWASAGCKCSCLPSFTERVNVKDGGIDAEWQIELPDNNNYSSPLLGPGWNVSQYKQRDIFAQSREKTFHGLKAGVQGAVKDLYRRTDRRPDRYVLFTNLHLSGSTKAKRAARPQKTELKESILKDYDQPNKVHVEIVGAAELAALLNDHPHLRSCFFATNKFATWNDAWDSHAKEKIFGGNIRLIGRDKELAALRSIIDEDNVRAIVVSGPHNIGKTRLALEATAHRPIETVFSVDPLTMSVNDLLLVNPQKGEIVVIIEDPDPEMADKFVDWVLTDTGKNLKLIITFPTAEKAPAPSFGRDNRVQNMQLGPITDSQGSQLLEAAGAKLDFGMESWIIEQAGGNPGIILVAAGLGQELRHDAGSFCDQVANVFEKKARRELGNDIIPIMQLLSMLSHVGVKGTSYKEIEIICKLFSDCIEPNIVLNELRRLEKAGIVNVQGSYVEIVPPIFANWLATAALRGRFDKLCALFAGPSHYARLRLLQRLNLLKGEEVRQFWHELFGANGFFKDLPSALESLYFLRLVAGSVPERVSQIIEEGLKNMNFQERLSIKGDTRRELMWTLEEVLFRRNTSAAAIRCLGLLAEAETEFYGNNATEVLCECFIPLHPQFPLPLDERLSLLKDLLSSKRSIELRLIGVKAIASALSGSLSVTLRRGRGPAPLDSRPSMTYGDVWNYLEGLFDLLIELVQSEDARLAQSAGEAISQVIPAFALQVRPKAAVARLQTAAEFISTQKAPIPVSAFTESLKLVRKNFSERGKNAKEALFEELRESIQQLDELTNGLDKSDFPTRLRKWAGSFTYEDHEYKLDQKGNRIYRTQEQLKVLANEAVKSPNILTNSLLMWLCSEEAQKAIRFCLLLGQMDCERKFLSRIERIGSLEKEAIVFAAYFAGLAQTDRQFVNNRLDELSQTRKVATEAIVRATGNIGGDLAGVKRIEILLNEKQVDPFFAERILSCGVWIDTLSPGEFIQLLKAIAGPILENAGAVIDLLGMWMHIDRPIEGDLAEFCWQCLEAAPDILPIKAHVCDELASKFAQPETERGFRLLETLLTKPYPRKCFNPIDQNGQNKFWNVLRNADRERAIRCILSLALNDPLQNLRITWDFPDVIDQQADGDLLIAYALEDEEKAELVSVSITSARPGFWPIALGIVEKYPENQRIQSALARSVVQLGRIVSGPYFEHLDNSRKEVQRVLNDPKTPPSSRPWLSELASSLRDWREKERISEANDDVNNLTHLVEDPFAPERLWAIKRLVRLEKFNEIQKVFSKEELLTILPKLQLSQDELEKLRRVIEDKN